MLFIALKNNAIILCINGQGTHRLLCRLLWRCYDVLIVIM